MLDFIQKHPDYLLMLGLLVFLVIRVIKVVINIDKNDGDDTDGDGGITSQDPILDLPPGVSLPSDPREAKEREILV